MLRPPDINHETFLSQDFSDPLMRMRSGFYTQQRGAHIVDFASVVGIYRRACNATEAGEEPLCKRVERVTSNLFLDLALARGSVKAEEVLYGGKVGGLHILSENLLPYSGFIRNRKSLLKRILLDPSVVLAEVKRQYR
jgi:hypothetical protein